MKKFLTCLFVALITVTFMGLQSAHAGWTQGANTIKVLSSADPAQLKPKPASSDLIYTLAAGQSLAQNDTIEITLTGGAKWNGTGGGGESVKMLASDGAIGAGVGAYSPPLSGGLAGGTTALWRVTEEISDPNSTLTLNAHSNIFDLTSVAVGSKVDVLITLKTSTGLIIGTANQAVSAVSDPAKYVFEGIKADTVTVTPRTDTVDVSADPSPFTKFTLGLGVTGTATAVNFTLNINGTYPADYYEEETVVYTITGNFDGIARVEAAGITGSDAAGDVTGGVVGQFLINAEKTAAYAVNSADVDPTLNIAPQFFLDGTTAQQSREFFVKVDVLAEAGVWLAHNALSSTLLYTIERNGSTRWLFNVPGSTSSDKGFIRISNTTNSAGKVTATMYNEAGQLIGIRDTELDADLDAQGTIIFNSDQLQALFGTWTGRARIEVIGELTGMEVMGMVRSPNGTLTNMSSMGLNPNE